MEKTKAPWCVVLFDIDGTLLTGPDSGPTAGFKSMSRAAKEVCGIEGVYSSVEFAGRTDEQIARSLLEAAGVSDPSHDEVLKVVSFYLSFLEENIKTTPYRVLGNPREAVDALRKERAIAELGTGNVRAGAKIKLTNAGIGDLFDYDKGGFGDGAKRRSDLLRDGAWRCNPEGDLPVVIIGDTPHDVSAAHEIGAVCIGVPYRHNDAKTLKRAGADAIVETLDSTLISVVEECLKAIGR